MHGAGSHTRGLWFRWWLGCWREPCSRSLPEIEHLLETTATVQPPLVGDIDCRRSIYARSSNTRVASHLGVHTEVTAQQTATTTEPTFRHLRSDDLDDVFELIQLAFGEGWPDIPIQVPPIEHLKWKVGGPQARGDDSSVVIVEGRIVGYSGGSNRDVWVQGQRHPAVQGGDQCIHPEFQGQGLTRPWNEWYDALPIPQSAGIGEGSTHPRLLRSQKRKGERVFIANKVDRLTLPLKSPSMRRAGRVTVRSVLSSLKLRAMRLGNQMRWSRYSTPAPALTLRTIETFDERADTFWERAKTAFDYAVVKDRQHLNWRYCDPRAGVYRVRVAERDDELAGFMVTAFRRGDSQVVDVLTLPGDQGALRALIEDAIADIRERDGEAVTVLMPRSHPYREAFNRYGFVRTKWVSNMGFKERKDSLLDFAEHNKDARLHFAFGDTDHV